MKERAKPFEEHEAVKGRLIKARVDRLQVQAHIGSLERIAPGLTHLTPKGLSALGLSPTVLRASTEARLQTVTLSAHADSLGKLIAEREKELETQTTSLKQASRQAYEAHAAEE